MMDSDIFLPKPIKIYNSLDYYYFQNDKKVISFNKISRVTKDVENFLPNEGMKLYERLYDAGNEYPQLAGGEPYHPARLHPLLQHDGEAPEQPERLCPEALLRHTDQHLQERWRQLFRHHQELGPLLADHGANGREEIPPQRPFTVGQPLDFRSAHLHHLLCHHCLAAQLPGHPFRSA